MTTWTDGVAALLPATYGFHPDLTPAMLNFALLSQGYGAPSESFSYCELGVGQGLSLTIHGATHPSAQFVAVEPNPTAAAQALSLTQSAALGNVVFCEEDYEELLKRDLPAFDYICLHGTYSWVSAATRQAIVDFIAAHLKVGGVVFLSYNCLPGLAAIAPLRELMVQFAARSSTAFPKRVEQAVDFATWLLNGNANYFVRNPDAQLRLQMLQDRERLEMAYEYFVKDWNPLYFSQVVSDLERAKLTYVTSTNLLDQADPLTFPNEIRERFNTIEDPVLRETIRDFMVNKPLRKDIFVKGPILLPAEVQRNRLLNQRFALVVPYDDVTWKHSFPRGEVTLQEDLYAPIVSAFLDGPLTTRQLITQPGISNMSVDRLLQALVMLVGIGYILPALPQAKEEERRASTDRFNQAMRERASLTREVQFMASPVTGGGVPMTRFEQLFFVAQDQREDPALFVWDILKRQGNRLSRDGQRLEEEEDNIAALRKFQETFETKRKPLLKQLGVI